MSRPTLAEELSDPALSVQDIVAIEALLASASELCIRPEHQVQTLTALYTLLPPRKSRMERLYESWPMLLLIRQVAVVRRNIWLASVLVLALGLLVTMALPAAAGFTFATLAPVVAAAGVAALYDDDTQAMYELEESTPTSGSLIVLTRLLLVFSYNLLLGICGSVLLVREGAALWTLIISWLAPMTFLCGLSFCLSVMTADILLAAVTPMLLWIVYLVIRQTAQAERLAHLSAFLGLTSMPVAPMLILSGAALALVTLTLQQRRTCYPGARV